MKNNTVTISPLLISEIEQLKANKAKQTNLKKDGTPKIIVHNKKRGTKSEAAVLDLEDMKKIVEHFLKREEWLHYLIFVVTCNMARRIGDVIGSDNHEYLPDGLLWEHFYNPMTGDFRNDLLEISEQKTDKLANPRINAAVKDAINLYIKKTGVDPSENNYHNPVFLQLSGNYRGVVISYDGYRKGLKRAAKALGLDERICTHSPRKTFGMINRMIHPNDPNSMELLQSIFNHSSAKVTKRYIGLTKKQIDAYYDDFGNYFNEYVIGDKIYKDFSDKPIISLDVNDLRDILKTAYEMGRDNFESMNPSTHMEAMNTLMSMIEELQK